MLYPCYYSYVSTFTVFPLYYIIYECISDLYGNVLLALYKRQKENANDPLTLGPTPKVVSNASTCLTKNAIIVTVVFFISFSYDLW